MSKSESLSENEIAMLERTLAEPREHNRTRRADAFSAYVPSLLAELRAGRETVASLVDGACRRARELSAAHRERDEARARIDEWQAALDEARTEVDALKGEIGRLLTERDAALRRAEAERDEAKRLLEQTRADATLEEEKCTAGWCCGKTCIRHEHEDTPHVRNPDYETFVDLFTAWFENR